jgi:coenzyme F420-0:L-glutamate ligase/coenzyme F420-1:gamma-L-glutamate ligase
VTSGRVEVIGLEGLPEVRPGDDLVELLAPALRTAGARDGDVLAVTQKIVSKAEGRLVPGDDRETTVAAETVRVVARRGDLVIAETRHGFVCANAGVDVSNVEDGMLSLLPEDPDASASRIRAGLADGLDLDVAVLITDTFGRPWRIGLVNVTIGCAGLPAVVDLRGSPDHVGRTLDATIVALADEVAAASGLVMAKDSRIPAALLRGIDRLGGDEGLALDLIRPADEDMFRWSAAASLASLEDADTFASAAVPRQALEDAIAATSAVPIFGADRPWRFTVLESAPARRAFRAAVGDEDPVTGTAPVLIVPWIRVADTADPKAGNDETLPGSADRLVLSSGAAIHALRLGLHAQGLASRWSTLPLPHQEHARDLLGVDDTWVGLGLVACGRTREGGTPEPRPPSDPGATATWR